MKMNQIELLIYGKSISGYTASTSYPEVSILSTSNVESPNYLLVTLNIQENAKPGKVKLVFNKANSKKIEFNWLLKSREPFKPNGFNASDLVYLLMPDRFANGDPSNDSIKGMKEYGINRAEMYHRHGGDIKGIIGKIDYLNDLGVTAVWPCPIMTNDQPLTSYHGYAITDFYQVDPRYGDIPTYRQLSDQLHTKKMKLIMDYVHNHVGSEHALVKDLPFKEFLNQHTSFTRTNYRPVANVDMHSSARDKFLNEKGWFDKHMPDVNQDHPMVANYLIQNNIWWIETVHLDGYRFDTYPYPSQSFLSKLNVALLKEYPSLSIVGEVWEQTVPNSAWYQKDNLIRKDGNSNLPSVTDFPFWFSLKDGLNEPFGWQTGISRFFYTIAQDMLYGDPNNNLIFLDNHDLSRCYSELKEDFSKWKIAMTILMTMRGIPEIYYGTEILMKNFAQPDGLVRSDFPGGWQGDKENKFVESGRTALENQAFNHIRTLAKWRNSRPSLYNGKLMQFIPEEEVFVYFRYNDSDANMVVVNTSEKEKKIDLSRFAERLQQFNSGKEILTGSSISIKGEMTVSPKTALAIELLK
jgi:glycosidase